MRNRNLNRRNPYPTYSREWEEFEADRDAAIEAEREEYLIQRDYGEL